MAHIPCAVPRAGPFVATNFELLRSRCDMITLYTDTNDFALFLSENLYNHSPSLGKHPFALVRQVGVPCSARILVAPRDGLGFPLLHCNAICEWPRFPLRVCSYQNCRAGTSTGSYVGMLRPSG